MNERDLKSKFREYLQQKWESLKKLDQTTDRFWNDIFNIFLSWLESYRSKPDRSYKQLFWEVVLPQMKNKLNSFWDYYFKNETYEKYESLFVNFMMFSRKNREYINEIMFDRRKEKLENLVEWQYWKIFNKKAFLEAWHNYIKEDTGKNWDKLRGYLTDIYGYLNIEWLKILYEIFFNSYEICSKLTSKNNEHKWKENYKKRDAFGEAFSTLESKLPGFNWEKLSEVKSLFWKYLNFVPKYRDIIFNTLDWKTDWWKTVQKDTEQSLIDDLSEEERAIADEDPFEYNGDSFGIDENPVIYENIGWNLNWVNLWAEWDWFWPIKVIRRSRDGNRWIYDETERWDIIAPINYWIFPEADDTSDWENEPEEEKQTPNEDNNKEENNGKIEPVKEEIDDDPNQDELYRFDPEVEHYWDR